MAKEEYFIENGLKGRLIKWFISQSAVPVDRSSHMDGKRAIQTLVSATESGESIAIHPEGTRSLDARVYRGKTGVIDLAWQTGLPIIPIGLKGTGIANPPHTKIPRFGKTIQIVFGEPMYFSDCHGGDCKVKRWQLQLLMERIAELADTQYVDRPIKK